MGPIEKAEWISAPDSSNASSLEQLQQAPDAAQQGAGKNSARRRIEKVFAALDSWVSLPVIPRWLG